MSNTAEPRSAADRAFAALALRPLTAALARPNSNRSEDFNATEEDADEVHAQLVRTPARSPTEFENAQKRILDVFSQWKAPANFKIELFVVRVGEWGGHMLVDCDDPVAVHKACSTFPAFEFQARPVIAVEDAVRVELEAIAWRDGLKRN